MELFYVTTWNGEAGNNGQYRSYYIVALTERVAKEEAKRLSGEWGVVYIRKDTNESTKVYIVR